MFLLFAVLTALTVSLLTITNDRRTIHVLDHGAESSLIGLNEVAWYSFILFYEH